MCNNKLLLLAYSHCCSVSLWCFQWTNFFLKCTHMISFTVQVSNVIIHIIRFTHHYITKCSRCKHIPNLPTGVWAVVSPMLLIWESERLFFTRYTVPAVNGPELRPVGEASPVLAGGDKWINVSRSSSICSSNTRRVSCASSLCGGCEIHVYVTIETRSSDEAIIGETRVIFYHSSGVILLIMSKWSAVSMQRFAWGGPASETLSQGFFPRLQWAQAVKVPAG